MNVQPDEWHVQVGNGGAGLGAERGLLITVAIIPSKKNGGWAPRLRWIKSTGKIFKCLLLGLRIGRKSRPSPHQKGAQMSQGLPLGKLSRAAQCMIFTIVALSAEFVKRLGSGSHSLNSHPAELGCLDNLYRPVLKGLLPLRPRHGLDDKVRARLLFIGN